MLDRFLLKLLPSKRSRTSRVWSWLVPWEMMEDLHGDNALSKAFLMPGIQPSEWCKSFLGTRRLASVADSSCNCGGIRRGS
ncbi:hypothetical protein RBWH47_02630 [Rhodopirellula baltica WH47]|uniref:Uncharacterized protein n=1 Tax=Rhodopirellula baltica WH47 TaxID=991778 RepID=F2AME3_RHOBT|nr:hypothetical protein RBWH47_02630 [Rhodopirellula baltica WH47]